MQQASHILTQRGVLTSFSIAKKVSEEEIALFFKKYKKTGKSEEQIGELLKEQIFKEITDAMIESKIPGIISPMNMVISKAEKTNEKTNENLIELNRFIMVIAHKLVEKKYDKLSLCYFINSLVNLLSLSERDFERFHRKTQNNDGEKDEDDN